MRPLPALAALALSLTALPAAANDGFGGLSATGLTFGQTDAVAMVSEDLRISPDRIEVDYVFRNTTATNVTGEVIFPLPPVGVWSSWESMMNLPEDLFGRGPGELHRHRRRPARDADHRPHRRDRTAVGGRPSPFRTIRHARPRRDRGPRPPRHSPDPRCRGGPRRPSGAAPGTAAEATELGLAEYIPEDKANNFPGDVWGAWSIVTRYHWTQTFPAGAEVKVSHAYDNRPPGGLFYWSHPPEDYQSSLADQYCIDEATSKGIAKALKNPEGDEYGNYGTALNISYVLRTANSWAGPIGSFRLTLDKGAPENILSLCAEGVKKTGPTTFVIEKTDYTPDRDLEVLIVQPMPKE